MTKCSLTNTDLERAQEVISTPTVQEPHVGNAISAYLSGNTSMFTHQFGT